MQTLHLVDVHLARKFIPSDLSIMEVLPGKTLGSLYLSNYQSGSSLEYSELIVVCALVRHHNHFGGWISHIYVDNPASVAGGREIWGLPKELAEFDWQAGTETRVTVRQQDQSLCQVTYQPGFALWPQPLAVPSLSRLGDRFLQFPARANFRPALVQSQLQIPSTSPFSSLHLGWPWLSVQLMELSLVVDAPVALT